MVYFTPEEEKQHQERLRADIQRQQDRELDEAAIISSKKQEREQAIAQRAEQIKADQVAQREARLNSEIEPLLQRARNDFFINNPACGESDWVRILPLVRHRLLKEHKESEQDAQRREFREKHPFSL